MLSAFFAGAALLTVCNPASTTVGLTDREELTEMEASAMCERYACMPVLSPGNPEPELQCVCLPEPGPVIA